MKIIRQDKEAAQALKDFNQRLSRPEQPSKIQPGPISKVLPGPISIFAPGGPPYLRQTLTSTPFPATSQLVGQNTGSVQHTEVDWAKGTAYVTLRGNGDHVAGIAALGVVLKPLPLTRYLTFVPLVTTISYEWSDDSAFATAHSNGYVGLEVVVIDATTYRARVISAARTQLWSDGTAWLEKHSDKVSNNSVYLRGQVDLTTSAFNNTQRTLVLLVYLEVSCDDAGITSTPASNAWAWAYMSVNTMWVGESEI